MRSRLDTRTRIRQVAARLFAQRGFDRTSVRDVVQAAGITQPTLYYYFHSKDGLGCAVLEQGYEDFLPILAQAIRPRGRPVERLVRLMAAHFDYVHDHPDITRFFYGVILGLGGRPAGFDVGAIRNRLIGFIRQVVEEIAPAGHLDPTRVDVLTMLVLGTINIHVLSMLDGWRELPSDRELRDTVQVLWDGVRRRRV